MRNELAMVGPLPDDVVVIMESMEWLRDCAEGLGYEWETYTGPRYNLWRWRYGPRAIKALGLNADEYEDYKDWQLEFETERACLRAALGDPPEDI